MEVIKAIRKLLFLEDCVIIPGLGGFVSQYRPAVIDKPTGTFIPPAKEILFNSELVKNDGTLVNFIAKQDGISIEASRQQVDQFVEETKRKLEHNDPVFIDGIGQFIQDKSRKIRFQADAGTNLYLESFGLASFHLREVAHESNTSLKDALIFSQEEPSGTIEFPAIAAKKTHSNHNLRRIAIAMPLLIAFSLMPHNSRITDTLTSFPASMVPEPSLFRLNYPDAMQRDTAKTIVFPISKEVTSDKVTSDSLKREDVKTEDVKTENVKTVVGKFPVIAGCFKVKSNADRLHKQLIEKGYPAAITTSRTGLYKVSIQSFASRQEALTGFDRLKRAEPGMQLWVAL
ncbi:MAG: SPOR domain-containing protein [Bacteroidia bacterium]|nr:SPOR domain-containing protein [Bacteroidia bacterium]